MVSVFRISAQIGQKISDLRPGQNDKKIHEQRYPRSAPIKCSNHVGGTPSEAKKDTRRRVFAGCSSIALQASCRMTASWHVAEISAYFALFHGKRRIPRESTWLNNTRESLALRLLARATKPTLLSHRHFITPPSAAPTPHHVPSRAQQLCLRHMPGCLAAAYTIPFQAQGCIYAQASIKNI